jgi:hypothetical protein
MVKSFVECGHLCLRNNDCRYFQHRSGKCSELNCKLCKEIPTSIKITRSHGTKRRHTDNTNANLHTTDVNNNRANPADCVAPSFVVLPYVKGVAEKISRVLRRENI